MRWAEALGRWSQGPHSGALVPWEALRAPPLDGRGTGQSEQSPPFSASPPPYFGVSGRKFCANKSLVLSVPSYFCRVAYFCCSFSTFSIFKHRFCTGHESQCHVALGKLSWVLARASSWRRESAVPTARAPGVRASGLEGGDRTHTQPAPSSPGLRSSSRALQGRAVGACLCDVGGSCPQEYPRSVSSFSVWAVLGPPHS